MKKNNVQTVFNLGYVVCVTICVFFSLLWFFEYRNENVNVIFIFFKYFILTGNLLAIFTIIYVIIKHKVYKPFRLVCIYSLFFLIFEFFGFLFPNKVSNLFIKKNIDPFDQFGYFNGNAAEYDPIRGYRWIKGEHQIVKFIDNTTIFNNEFKVNNKGCVSSIPYSNYKADNTKFRFIVFGDSFTASEYLSTTWPDLCSKKMETVEFYNFAIDGGGLPGWYNTFFKEIVPSYEFDGVVLGVFGNDLDRGFVVMHHESPYSYTGSLAINQSEISIDSLKKTFSKEKVIYSSAPLDSLIENRKQFKMNKYSKFNWVLFKNIESSFINIAFGLKIKEFIKKFIYSEHDMNINENYFKEKYGENYNYLLEIFSYCKTHDKNVIIVSVPELYGISLQKSGKELIINQELEYLSKMHNFIFINGYSYFEDLSKPEIVNLYLKHDGHWDEHGIEIFSDSLVKTLNTYSFFDSI